MAQEMREVRIDSIRPNYRLVFDRDAISGLYDDIKCNGLQQPLSVEMIEYWFQIIDGEKRWRACKKLGFSRVKAVILI